MYWMSLTDNMAMVGMALAVALLICISDHHKVKREGKENTGSELRKEFLNASVGVYVLTLAVVYIFHGLRVILF